MYRHEEPRITKRDLPIVTNFFTIANSKAVVVHETDRVKLEITIEDPKRDFIAEFLEQPEPIGISFIPLPVLNIREMKERNI